MTSSKLNHIALAEYFCSRATIPAFSAVALKLAYVTLIWNNRINTRKALRKLGTLRLKDVGMTSAEADIECRKPFWRA